MFENKFSWKGFLWKEKFLSEKFFLRIFFSGNIKERWAKVANLWERK